MLLCLAVPACLVSCSGGSRQAGQGRPELPPVEITAQTDRTTATIAETITFTLSALYAKGSTVQLPEVGTRIAGLRIVDFGEEGPREIDNRLSYKKWYKLQADIVGAYIIPSMTATCTVPDNSTRRELKTPQIFIQVKSTLTNEKGETATDILDIKPQQEVPRDLRPWIIGAGAAVILAGALAGVLLYRRRRKKQQLEVGKSAHEIAFEELAKLKQEHLVERGIVREHYFRLSDIFRHYIENRFAIPAVEQTTQELLPEIMNLAGITRQVKTQVREVLFHADMVKFAKYLPAGEEISGNQETIVSIINQTKMQETVGNYPPVGKGPPANSQSSQATTHDPQATNHDPLPENRGDA
jgi:hypothetical protein